MKNLITICLTFISLATFSQKHDSTAIKADTNKVTKWEMFISGSPDYAFRKLKADAESQWIKDSRDSLEIPKLGYTVGIGVGYSVKKNLKIEAGIFFSDKGQRTKKDIAYQTPSGQEPIKYSYNYHYYYLDVPVKASYYLLTGKLKFYITAGLSANIFLNEKTTSIVSSANSETKTTTNTTSGFKTLNIQVLGGCGLNYPLGKRTNIKLEPTYMRSINSVINTPVKGYLYSFGANVGFGWNL
jgi:opacity protein-like surface antigen